MKSFEEIRKRISLVKSSMSSVFGSKYIDTNLPIDKMIVVQHLDNVLANEVFPIYEELYNEIMKWIEARPIVKDYVFISPLIEIGKDYFIRRFYAYDVSIDDYMVDKDDDFYVEPPELFGEMQREISKILIDSDGREGIIKKVLRKSLLEPTGKTFFGYRKNKFIIVEPKISIDDLKKWKEFCEDSHND